MQLNILILAQKNLKELGAKYAKYINGNSEAWFFISLAVANLIISIFDIKEIRRNCEVYLFGISFSVFLVSFCALYVAFKMFRYYRCMEDTPTSTTRACSQGFAELEGIQDNLPGQEILTPLSKKKCTWYKYTIEHYVAGVGNKSSRWQTIESGESVEQFILNDSTGSCLIDPKDCEVKTNLQKSWRGVNKNDSLNNKSIGSVGGYRFTEYYMLPNTPLYAIGIFTTKDNINYLTKDESSNKKPFILSNISQKALIKKYKIKTLIYIAIFIGICSAFPIIMDLAIQRHSLVAAPAKDSSKKHVQHKS